MQVVDDIPFRDVRGHHHAIVAHDFLPSCGHHSNDARTLRVKGANVLPSNEALVNSCWIQTVLHTLYSDPYVRHFVHRFRQLGGRYASRRPTQFEMQYAAQYQQALTVMLALMTMSKPVFDQSISQDEYDDEMAKRVLWLRSLLFADDDPSSTGDVLEATKVMYALLMWLFEVEFTGNLLAHQMRCYGARPLFLRHSQCLTHSAHSTMLYWRHEVGDTAWLHIRLPEIEPGRSEIELLINDRLKELSQWKVSRCGDCGEYSRVRDQLMTLPWMLYVQVGRIDARSSVGCTLPSRTMKVGPLQCGATASYYLHSRQVFNRHHYTFEQRKEFRMMRKWSFGRVSNVPFRLEDTDSCLLVFKRVDPPIRDMPF